MQILGSDQFLNNQTIFTSLNLEVALLINNQFEVFEEIWVVFVALLRLKVKMNFLADISRGERGIQSQIISSV